MCILEKAGWNGGLNYHIYQLETEIEKCLWFLFIESLEDSNNECTAN